MAAPITRASSTNEKILPLIDSTATTSLTRIPVSLNSANQSAGGDTSYPPGWLGVGSHRDGDTLLTPGGFTLAAGQTPILVMGGADRVSATEGSRVSRPIAIHEGGPVLTLPGSSYSTANAFQQPLMAVGGSFLAAAATANQTLTTTLASNFGYMTDILLTVDIVLTAAATVLILDASGGTTRYQLQFPATAWPVKHTQFPFHFTVPIRTAAAGAAFFVTTTGATGTWTIQCNGYFSTAV